MFIEKIGIMYTSKTSLKNRYRRTLAEINVIPYVDVTLVLLIIFMITTSTLNHVINVNIPSIDTTSTVLNVNKLFTIDVTNNEKYFINQENQYKEFTLDELKHYIKNLIKELSTIRIFIRGDQDVSYGTIVNLMGILQQTGVNEIGIIYDSIAVKN